MYILYSTGNGTMKVIKHYDSYINALRDRITLHLKGGLNYKKTLILEVNNEINIKARSD